MNVRLFASCLLVLCSFLDCEPNKRDAGDAASNCLQKNQDTVEMLTLLISDYGPYSTTQIIQFRDSTMKHGFATVVYPFEKIGEKDIIWNYMYTVDGKEYPLVERKLNQKEYGIVKKALHEFDSSSFTDPYSHTDDYQYVIYVGDRKVASIFTCSLDLERFPQKYRLIIKDILSIAAPIYPNYGLW